MTDSTMMFTQQQPDGSTRQYRGAIGQAQKAHNNGQMVLFLRDGQLVNSGDFFTGTRNGLAQAFEAGLNGGNVGNTQLGKAYGASVTAYAASNYRADTISTVALKVTDPNGADAPLSPAHWYLKNASLLNWQIEMGLVIFGVCYLKKIKNPSNAPTGLRWLDPQYVRFDPYIFNGQGGWVLSSNDYNQKDEHLPVDELIYMTTFDPTGSDNGKSAFEVAMSPITTEQGMSQYAGAFFVNRARPDGMLISKKPIVDPKKQEKIKEEWRQFQSADNAFKTWITSGDWQWIPISQDFGQLAMPELGASVQKDIAMALRVNPILIGAGLPSDPLSAQSTYRQVERAHLDSVALPRLNNLILAQLNRQWLWVDFSRKHHFTLVVDRVNTPALSDVNDSTVTQSTAMSVSGLSTFDEARKNMGLPPDDNYLLRNPTDTLAMFNAGTLTIDEQRQMTGNVAFNQGNGRLVLLADGRLVPISRLAEIANANADLIINPPDPAPNDGGSFFGLSDISAFRQLLQDTVEDVINVRLNAPPLVPAQVSHPDSDDLQLVIEGDGLVVRSIDVVSIGLNLSGNAFVQYMVRDLSKRLVGADVLNTTWIDSSGWFVPLLRFEGLKPHEAQRLINGIEIEGEKVRGTIGGLSFNADNGKISAILQGDDVQAMTNVLVRKSKELELTPLVADTFGIYLGTVTDNIDNLTLFDNDTVYQASFDVVDVRFNGDVAHAWGLRHYTEQQGKELDNWQHKEYKHRSRRSRPHARFKTRVLPPDIIGLVHWGLRLGGDPVAVFDVARARLRGQDELLVDDLATPDEYEAYWHNFDALMVEVGDDWLEHYMSKAYDTILAQLRGGDAPSITDIGTALRTNHDSLIEQWVGTDPENLGVISELILAGQAAGNEALINNMPADYRALIRGINGQISWEHANEQAFAFARSYTFDLIKGIDQTTMRKVQEGLSDWLVDPTGTLDDLEDLLRPVFEDRKRARVVANTESIRAYNEGAQERWRTVGVEQARWMTVRDSSVCPICEGLRGVTAPFADGFGHRGGVVTNEETGDKVDASKFEGQRFKPPAHPNCRCFLKPLVPDATVIELPDGNPPDGGEKQEDRADTDDDVPTDKMTRNEARRAMPFKDAQKLARADLDKLRAQILEDTKDMALRRSSNQDAQKELYDFQMQERKRIKLVQDEIDHEMHRLGLGKLEGYGLFQSWQPHPQLNDDQRALFDKHDKARRQTIDDQEQARRTHREKIGVLEVELREIKIEQKTSYLRHVEETPDSNINLDYKNGSKAFSGKKDPRAQNLRDAYDYLNKVIDGDIHPQDIPILPKAKRGRAYYSHGTRSINIAKHDSVSTLIHEMTHALEYSDPHIRKRAVEFRNGRSTGRPVKLSKLTGNSSYGRGEVAYEDAWKHPYMGKEYLETRKVKEGYTDTNGKWVAGVFVEEDRATEILTMGIEELYNNPDEFARDDPDYFDFIVSILRGLI